MRTIGWLFTISFLLGCFQPSKGQTIFNFPQDEFDFGLVEEGENLSYSFEFINAGKDTIHLKEESRDVRPSCSCTASEYTKTPIAPGQTGYIKAGYQTSGRVGSFEKTITVSQKNQPHKTLTIKGMVIKKGEAAPVLVNQKKFPVFLINKTDHYFGKIEKGQNVSYRFNLSNTGKDTLKILNSYSACKCIHYKMLHPKDMTALTYLLPGKSAILEVNYMPSAPSGLSDKKTLDLLTLITNDTKNKKVVIKLSSEIEDSLSGKSPVKENTNVPFQK